MRRASPSTFIVTSFHASHFASSHLLIFSPSHLCLGIPFIRISILHQVSSPDDLPLHVVCSMKRIESFHNLTIHHQMGYLTPNVNGCFKTLFPPSAVPSLSPVSISSHPAIPPSRCVGTQSGALVESFTPLFRGLPPNQ